MSMDTMDIVANVLAVVVGVVVAVGAVGISTAFTIAGLGKLAERLMQDTATLAAIERLGDSVPRETVEQITNATRTANETLGELASTINRLHLLVVEALDGIPHDTKRAALDETQGGGADG
jgi:hypothetical protein